MLRDTNVQQIFSARIFLGKRIIVVIYNALGNVRVRVRIRS